MHRFLMPIAIITISACSGSEKEAEPPSNIGPSESTPDSGLEDVDGVQGHCLYVNPFSSGDECKEYVGTGWTADTAAEDCTAPLPGADAGTFVPSAACSRDAILGECLIAAGEPLANTLVFPGDDPDSCGGVVIGCDFAQGEFVPAEVCEGTAGGGGVDSSTAFQPFELVCVDPIDGEPPGDGPDGQVCTWVAISGNTEAGRHYSDYASCDPVLTQRPYYAVDVGWETADDDPRLTDPAFQEELSWVTSEVEAAACMCCHSSELAPSGPSMWYVEAGPIWTDSLTDPGAAMMAGWIDSTAFGRFEPADNNGFDRATTGLATTDVARMLAFWESDLARRGLIREDFADSVPFGGPLYDQLTYEPSACTDGEGVDADGVVTWSGGAARYVYVLGPESDNPGVPPNLDLPADTLWRLDVEWTAPAISSGLRYGEAPDGAAQAFPEAGAPSPLVPGEVYYLYVLADIYQPVTRCLFTAE
ncbi:MAG: proteinase inhibitor [Deltaproteobacteria bacterium]|nr:proteinase inhibitor [Deltaproteobacteria bacterium]HCH62938.1 proteinase inhibitor [Deltaproteobacteria bacterium]